jgi:hypothetical protein
MKAQLSALGRSGVNHFGRFGMSTFECDNYISTVHGDFDIGSEDLEAGKGIKDCLGGYFPCVQLEKKGCKKHEYDFAYVRWGVVIQTHRNTVWCVPYFLSILDLLSISSRVFNGRHEHGTVMPSQSSVNNNAQSSGKHPTVRARDVIRANNLRRIRCGYNLRPRV